jgi:hypothetical protein
MGKREARVRERAGRSPGRRRGGIDWRGIDGNKSSYSNKFVHVCYDADMMQRKVVERRRGVSISAAIENGRAKYPIDMRLMSCVVAGGGPYSETGMGYDRCTSMLGVYNTKWYWGPEGYAQLKPRLICHSESVS